MKLQIDLPDKINKKLKIYKALEGYNNLEDATISLIDKGVNFEFIKQHCKTVGDVKTLNNEIETQSITKEDENK